MTDQEKKLDRVCRSNAYMQERINDRAIMYAAHNMLTPAGNSALLLDELIGSGIADKFTHIIAVSKFSSGYEKLKERLAGLDVRFVTSDSDEYVKALAVSKYIISDGRLPQYFVKRDKQVLLCLIDQKSILFSEDEEAAYKETVFNSINRIIPQASYLLCANEAVLERLKERLFIDDFFGGRLIRAADPAYYGIQAEEEAAADSDVQTEPAKYSAADIERILEQYSDTDTAADVESEEQEESGSYLGDDVPDRKTSLDNIIGAMFFGEGSFFEFEKSSREKLVFISFLNIPSRNALALRNLCDRIDRNKYSVTVYAYATTQTKLCASFAEGTRVIMRGDYTFSQGDMQFQAAANEELTEKQIWKYEILRSLGSDDFDAVTVYNTVNQFRHRFAGYMHTGLRIYATPSEAELFEGYYAPDRLAALINEIYDRTLLLEGEGSRLKNTSPMPIAYSRSWKTLICDRTEPILLEDGGRQLMVAAPSVYMPFDCVLIPLASGASEMIYAIAANADDAAAVKECFDEYRASHADAKMYLNVLEDSERASGRLSDSSTAVFISRSIPLLVLAGCDKFVYPYEGGTGLNIAASILGAAAEKQPPTAKEMLLMAGTGGDTLYCSYKPQLPEGRLRADVSMFDLPAADAELLWRYEKSIADRINNELFSIERQESE